MSRSLREGRPVYRVKEAARDQDARASACYPEAVDAAGPSDRIEIAGLVVTTVVGALPHEREFAQPVRIDLSIDADLRDAGRSDELGDTAHYGLVVERVAALVRDSNDTLLERLAARIAEAVVGFDRIDAVEVLLTKLRPPIPEQVATTSVRIHRRRSDFALDPPSGRRAIVALGSNLGDRVGHLSSAVSQLDVVAASQVYETAPVGGPDGQGAYLNMVVVVDTSLDPFAFLRRCQRIEASASRERTVRWGPRTLDVDILFFDEMTINSPELTVPHPRYAVRRFVLAPLSEVAPERCPSGWEATLPPDVVTPIGQIGSLGS